MQARSQTRGTYRRAATPLKPEWSYLFLIQSRHAVLINSKTNKIWMVLGIPPDSAAGPNANFDACYWKRT